MRRYDHCTFVDFFLKEKSIDLEKLIRERDFEILKKHNYFNKSILDILKFYTDYMLSLDFDTKYQGKTPFILAVEKRKR